MITISTEAIEKIKYNLEKRGKGLGIRIGVKTTGCSGLAYILEYVDNALSDDTIYEHSGFNIYIDKKSLVYLNGLEMNWVKKGINSGFEFKNPNEKNIVSDCGWAVFDGYCHNNSYRFRITDKAMKKIKTMSKSRDSRKGLFDE